MRLKAFRRSVQGNPEGRIVGHTTTKEQNLSGEKAKKQGAKAAETVWHEGSEVPPYQEQVQPIQERWVCARNRRAGSNLITRILAGLGTDEQETGEWAVEREGKCLIQETIWTMTTNMWVAMQGEGAVGDSRSARKLHRGG